MDLTVYGNGACNKDYCYEYRTRDTINKMACYFPDKKDHLVCALAYDTSAGSYLQNTIKSATKLFVASECKTGRDTFRNSNYSITRDKTKADIIVVPDIIPRSYLSLDCNLVAHDEKEEKLYLVTITKYGFEYGMDIKKDEIEIAKSFIESSMKLTVDDSALNKLKVWFLPKCEEVVDILSNNKLNVPYIQESKVPINPSTIISPETLVLWENIEDENLLVRTICTSDWQKYPVTLLALLFAFRNKTNWYNVATGDFRRILKAIGYEYDWREHWRYEEDDSDALRIFKNKRFTMDDYGMFQKYIYCRFGVDENGGFISGNQWESLPRCIRILLPRRIAVKRISLPAAMTCDELINLASK